MTMMNLNQEATYWPVTANDPNGDSTFGAPVKISCRWINRDGTVKTEKGDEEKVEYAVYSTVVVPRNSYIAFGDQTGEVSPVKDSRQVIGIVNNPSMNDLKKYLA